MFRQNYEIPVSTRVDDNTKRSLEHIAAARKQRLSELLRDIITAFVEERGDEYEMAGLLPVGGRGGE